MTSSASSATLKDLICAYRSALMDGDDLPLWVQMMVGFFEYNPNPSWVKVVLSEDGRLSMLRVNKAFETQLGVASADYDGSTDQELWGKVLAQSAAEHDEYVITTRQPIATVEYFTNPLTQRRQCWVGWKWPVVVSGEVVAVCGCATLDPERSDA